MMQQQGFVVCDVPEVNKLSKLPSFLILRTAIFAIATQVTPSPVV